MIEIWFRIGVSVPLGTEEKTRKEGFGCLPDQGVPDLGFSEAKTSPYSIIVPELYVCFACWRPTIEGVMSKNMRSESIIRRMFGTISPVSPPNLLGLKIRLIMTEELERRTRRTVLSTASMK